MLARLVCLLVLSCTVFAAAVRAEQARSPYAPVADDPALPRILIIGDSISIGYTLGVRDLLKGKAKAKMKNKDDYVDVISSGKSFLPVDQTGCKLA